VNEDIDVVLGALADPTRRAVVRLLGRRPLRSGEIAAALRASRPTMSRHLRVLRRARLVEESALEEDARGRVYRLRPEPLSGLRGWLEEAESFWSEQLDAFKAHAESRERNEP
jgi:DNA-binding transcriptional ArsR family regulator